MNLKRKIKTLRALKADVARLEREIHSEGSAILRKQGLLMNPRLERIMEQFA